MKSLGAAIVVAIVAVTAAPALSRPFRLEEVASVAALSSAELAPQTIAFADHKGDAAADPVTGLVRFEDWERSRPLQKKALSLYPAYVEPVLKTTANGVTKSSRKRLHVYVAEARFVLQKRPGSLDLARYASLPFLEKIDPAIKHRLIAGAEAVPNKDSEAANRNPARAWCEPALRGVCIASHYTLEGKLPVAVRLANKLEEGGKKIPDFLEFQSELRTLSAEDVAALGAGELTKLGTRVIGGLEQDTFYVNQILAFGKLLALFQTHPTDADKTVVTAYMVLAIKSDVLEKKKEFERVPILRNLLPAQVLVGNSSFNTGTSISAGLPKYVRNRILAIAELMNGDD